MEATEFCKLTCRIWLNCPWKTVGLQRISMTNTKLLIRSTSIDMSIASAH